MLSAEATTEGAVYDVLRRDLIHLLMEHRSQGGFTRAAQGADEARSLFLTELTRSLADILVSACPKNDSNGYAAALADADTIARSILDRDLLTSHY